MIDLLDMIFNFFVDWLLPETDYSRKRGKKSQERNAERYPGHFTEPYRTPLEEIKYFFSHHNTRR